MKQSFGIYVSLLSSVNKQLKSPLFLALVTLQFELTKVKMGPNGAGQVEIISHD